jgi:hypothetical protein
LGGDRRAQIDRLGRVHVRIDDEAADAEHQQGPRNPQRRRPAPGGVRRCGLGIARGHAGRSLLEACPQFVR